MVKILIFFFIITLALTTRAQTVPSTQPYGTIDKADLEMQSCDFEKDANAMVLFDRSEITTGFTSTTIFCHKRIKVFNDKGNDAATIKMDYDSNDSENISDVEAETINLNKNTIEFTKVDKNSIYRQNVDRSTKRITFTFPQVKAGSIIEYAYKITVGVGGRFPDWYFQGGLPVRYCELNAAIRNDYVYKMTPRVHQAYTKNTAAPLD